jgi:hypothetical protein
MAPLCAGWLYLVVPRKQRGVFVSCQQRLVPCVQAVQCVWIVLSVVASAATRTLRENVFVKEQTADAI